MKETRFSGFIKTLRFYADFLALAISPMILLLLLIGLFTLVDRWFAHEYDLKKFLQTGLIAQAQVVQIDAKSELVHVEFIDASGEARTGALITRPYPAERLAGLKPGSDITIRYLPYFYEKYVLLEAGLEDVRNDRSFLLEYVLVVGVCWFFIILRPEVLYLGYASEVWKLFLRRYN